MHTALSSVGLKVRMKGIEKLKKSNNNNKNTLSMPPIAIVYKDTHHPEIKTRRRRRHATEKELMIAVAALATKAMTMCRHQQPIHTVTMNGAREKKIRHTLKLS